MKGIRILAVMVSQVALLFCADLAQAQFLTVGCAGGDPTAQFSSINSALLNVTGPGAFLLVTGTCTENVFLYGANNLTLGAPFSKTANLNGNLFIQNSQNVYVYGLNVSNTSGDGIRITSGHSVTLDSCSSSGNGGNGMTVGQQSDVSIINFGTFSNNRNEGMFVGQNSMVNVASFGGTTEISNNQSSAVGVDRSVFEAFGTHMAGNGQMAIDSKGAGKTVIFSFLGVNPTVIENNLKGGVSLQEGSEISIGSVLPAAPNVISNNGPFGIEAGFGSQVTLVGVIVTGHTGPGVDIYGHSQLYGTSQLSGLGATQISNNGTAGDPLSAGIRVDGDSETLLRGVTISQNIGPAILALVNSSVDFAGNTFNGNAGVITCDSTSSMVSDLAKNARTPAAGVICSTAHTLGNRVMSVPAPAVPDISVWKKLHRDYQQRSAARK